MDNRPLRIMLSGGSYQLIKLLLGADLDRVTLIRGASSGTSRAALPTRLKAGEKADIIVVAEPGLNEVSAFFTQAHRPRHLASSLIAIGTARPERFSAPATFEDLIALLDSVNAFSYSSSVSGTHLVEKMEELKVSSRILEKGRSAGSLPVGRVLVAGEADVGFQQFGELLEIEGVKVLGLVPDELQSETRYYIAPLAHAKNVGRADDFIREILRRRSAENLARFGLSFDDQSSIG